MLKVINLNIFQDIIINCIEPPIMVHSQKGRTFKMQNRKFFGLSLCISGQITYTMNGKKYVSDKSSAVILPKGADYSLFGDREGIFPVINFDCENFSCDEILLLPLQDNSKCINLFNQIKNLSFRTDSRLKIFSEFYKLLNEITKSSSPLSSTLKNALEYIERNISDTTLSNTKIAEDLKISEVYLRKLFSSNLKTSPKQYIIDRRIQKAKQLLLDTPFSVTAISKDCGFTSPYHFCRIFKQKESLTPTEYIKAYKVYKI